MKQLYAILILLMSCTNKPTSGTFNKMSENKVIQVAKSVKSFSNPANIYGSDFINLLSKIQITQGNTALYNYISSGSKKKYSKNEIENYFKTTNLNFIKKLKAIRKLSDTLFVLCYSCKIEATQIIKEYKIAIEKDSCRLVIEK
ncbi:MAG: hypothetical protein ACHQII_07635 [Bacteroidia bacterium]